jgi:hypothetical protein
MPDQGMTQEQISRAVRAVPQSHMAGNHLQVHGRPSFSLQRVVCCSLQSARIPVDIANEGLCMEG